MAAIVSKIENNLSLLGQIDLDDRDSVDDLCLHLEALYIDMIEADLSGYVDPQVIRIVFECWKLFREEEAVDSIPGRPCFEISPSVIENLLELQFTSCDIALILGVSRSTVCRRMRQFGLSCRERYCCISDDNLDEIVKTISGQHPGCGSKMMMGHLRTQGIIVQQERVREALRRTDPQGVASRFRCSIRRRVYDVPAPQCLWHIDGNHKLVRWRFVDHGGIDGFSRLPVYLKCSPTNTSGEVLIYFLEAVGKYGCPLRVRSDMGGENIRVAEHMWSLQHTGTGQGMIMGRSVHNQRIERLWRDVFQGCLCLFHSIFSYLETCGYLDPCNELHLLALHFVYLPRIQQSLDNFRHAYANHPLSSFGRRTPNQLFVSGSIWHSQHNQQGAARQMYDGIDLSALLPHPHDDDTTAVVVPPVTVPNAELCLEQLRRYNVDPLYDDSNNGISLYLQCLTILQ